MKKYVISFMFLMFVSFSFLGIKVYAYSPSSVSTTQLNTALNAFKDKVASEPTWYTVGDPQYWHIFYDGSGYYIRYDSRKSTLMAPLQGSNSNSVYPAIGIYPYSNGWGATMFINSDGSYTLPSTVTSGVPNKMEFYNSSAFVIYTNYSINRSETGIWIRGAVPLGTQYRPTTWDGPSYVYNSTLVPTPSNLRIKLITPTGLFPKIKETQVQLTWTPTSGALRTEVYILYTYKTGNDKVTKLLPYITYSDGLFASVGTVTKLMNTDIEAFIHSKNTATAGQTFANGKLSFTHYYVRYVTPNDDSLLYGNWVKIDVVTGGSILDTGDIVSQYNEVYTDENGDEVEVTEGSEYNGIKVDTDGNTVDPTSLRTMEDYLLAIPNLMKNLFSGLSSMLNSVGSFGAFYSSAFSFLPPGVPLLITGAIAFVIAVGVIKILK